MIKIDYNEIYVRNIEGVYMKLSYKKLFKLLIDKEISGIELMNNASIIRLVEVVIIK